MKKENLKYKDTVFRNLFGSDEKAEEKFIQLYNALHDRDLNESHTIKSLDIEQVLYMNFANDIARLVDDKIIILAEHQSTINENMPLRCLQYVGRIYEQLQDSKARFYKQLMKIPTPEFYVFYNGLEDYPVYKELRLSDAFMLKEQDIQLELSVNVININTEKENDLLTKCPVLSEYSRFVDKMRNHLAKDNESGYNEAIRACIQNNILKEYLNRKAKEVNNMLIGEYDYDLDVAAQREEAAKEATRKAEARTQAEIKKINANIVNNMKNAKYEFSEISKITGLSIEEIESM